jgi:hypothetical protein
MKAEEQARAQAEALEREEAHRSAMAHSGLVAPGDEDEEYDLALPDYGEEVDDALMKDERPSPSDNRAQLEMRRLAALEQLGPADTRAYDAIPIKLPERSDIVPGSGNLNRYLNILPTESSMVRLQEPVTPFGDEDETFSEEHQEVRSHYINANYVRGFDGQYDRYIAAQVYQTLSRVVNAYFL